MARTTRQLVVGMMMTGLVGAGRAAAAADWNAPGRAPLFHRNQGCPTTVVLSLTRRS